MTVLQEYKCPCCGGAISYDGSIGKMKCPYCDTEYEAETLRQYDDALSGAQGDRMDWDTLPEAQWNDGEAEGLRVYVCQSCGGEIVGDETIGATLCPFCDNPVVMMGQFGGALKPDWVIPFKLDKKAAIDALNRHYGGKKLLPKVFGDQNHIEEVKGIYVPFWLFDTDVTAQIRYKGTRTRTWDDSRFHYTETAHYSILRGGEIGFSKVPVDGSSKMDNKLMESIEPYHFRDAVDFGTAYLAGYLADKYDVNAEESIERANDRIKKSTEKAFAKTVSGYDSVVPDTSAIQLKNGKAGYALLPVWVLNTTWKGEKYTFAMNGQTGKLVGDLPVDKGAARRMQMKWTALIAAAAFLASWLLWLL